MIVHQGPGAKAFGPCLLLAAIASCSGGPVLPPAPSVPLDTDSPARTYWHLPVRQPEGVAVQPPDRCGECHRRQWQDWKASVHARAYSPGLRAQILGASGETQASCLLCHAPLERQMKFREHGEPSVAARTEDYATQSLIEAKLSDYRTGKVQLGDNPHYDAELAQHGLTCAGCHVRGGVIHGPPRAQDPPEILAGTGEAHAPAVRLPFFETAEFCAECHQFTMKNRAGDKPLQNTYVEWQQSPYGQNKVACVFCHMPKRRHLWQGVHSADMVGGALGVDTEIERQGDDVVAVMTLMNEGAGHAMPTYVTPRFTAILRAVDAAGVVVAQTEYVIQRQVKPGNPWQELSDTRLMPLVPVEVSLRAPAATTRAFEQLVRVEPDYFYNGVFTRMVKRATGENLELARVALRETEESVYVVHEETIPVD